METVPITTNANAYPEAATTLPATHTDHDSQPLVAAMYVLNCVPPIFGFVMSMNRA